MKFDSIESAPPARLAVITVSIGWVLLMALCSLYTTMAISAIDVQRYYSLSVSNALVRSSIWTGWLCLLFGLVALRLTRVAGLLLSLIGWIAAIALITFDSIHPTLNHPQTNLSRQEISWLAGYIIAYLIALGCSTYLNRIGRTPIRKH